MLQHGSARVSNTKRIRDCWLTIKVIYYSIQFKAASDRTTTAAKVNEPDANQTPVKRLYRARSLSRTEHESDIHLLAIVQTAQHHERDH